MNSLDFGDNYASHYLLGGESMKTIVGVVGLEIQSCANCYCLFLMISPGRGFQWRDEASSYNVDVSL
jgi:hypothetical protein